MVLVEIVPSFIVSHDTLVQIDQSDHQCTDCKMIIFEQ